ncbi:phage tail tube protein [Cellulomonas gilvus]|uniref:Uncharacterized protein n=1 Tax=Cellulomonas gilvus (strain ATCC 13127 / NRRL B-14078) TaxID=593907 RepID=F8A2F8_CELGA|nr:hypothetical protein [Cellulomonas gilvus]AEI11815.1 hypothetical protein Celgi_1296 [Cellulomonas gilvus ATCC 13127]
MATGTPDLPVTPVDGNVRIDILSTIANIDAPADTELNAAAGLNASCYLTADSALIGIEQASIAVQLLCQTVDRNEPGRKTVTLGMTAVDNTNSAAATDSNKFAEMLVEGTVLYFSMRYGKAWDAAHAADDEVYIVKFKVGQKIPMAPEANSYTRSVFNTFVQDFAGPVAVVAGP